MRSDNRPVVLVVDDDPVNLEVVGQILADEYRVLVATHGEQAVTLVETVPIDLILLDVVMPGMDGYAVCRRLKELETICDIPVIFVTAIREEQYETTGFELGGVDYITKPVYPLILRARVKTHLELKKNTDLLRALSHQDGLTGLANRRFLDQTLALEWKRAVRRGNSWLSVILLDVDCFKKYNDSYGHLAGDATLRQVAHALQSCLERETDCVARYGGEEFCCVLPETPLAGATALAERIRKAVWGLELPHRESDVADRVTISLGVAALIPTRALTLEWLLGQADEQLYLAKRAGRNAVQGVELSATTLVTSFSKRRS
ncbi:MAG: diguanylate cyclase [Magnetococcales bacterium]|nr:diguanylate cyclase [Magnetococcales bacterium]NGZ04783.1 diguanylate cyclase [Magnetococcales bacterium]